MTALSLELMDITKDPPLWCFARPLLQLTSIVVCLWAFSFVFSKWNACSIGLRSGDWLGHCKNIALFYLQKLLGCFCCMFWVIVHLYYEAPSNQICCIWSSVTSSLNTSDPVPLEAMLMPSHCSTMFLRWCCMLWIMSCSKPSPYFFLPVILVQVDLNFSHPMNAFPEVFWFFRCFLAKSNVALFAPCGEPSVFALVKSCLEVLRGRSGLFMLLSSPVRSFFLRMYQTVDLTTPDVPAISLMDLFCFWSLTIICFTCMERSFDRMMRVHSNSFQMQLAHLESTPDLLPA